MLHSRDNSQHNIFQENFHFREYDWMAQFGVQQQLLTAFSNC